MTYPPDLEKRAEVFPLLRSFLWAPIDTEYGRWKASYGSRIREGKGPFIFSATKPNTAHRRFGTDDMYDFPNPCFRWGNPSFEDYMAAWAWMDERREDAA